MSGFSTPAAGGITKLSQLEIDADKDWLGKGVWNLKAIASAMTKGDIPYRGSSILQKLSLDYGIGWNFLHALDVGVGEPEWKDIQELIIYLTGALNRWVSLPILSISVPTISLVVAEDHSGGGFTSGLSLAVSAPSLALSEIAVFDQLYESGDDGDFSLYGVNWEAQTFTVNVAHSLEIIEIKCRLVGAAATVGNITIGVRATDGGGLPTGADLTSVTFPASDLPSANAWLTKYLAAYALSAATKYAIVIRASGGDASNYMVWRKDGTAPAYAGGARCFSTNSGGSWSEDVNTDFVFREGEVK